MAKTMRSAAVILTAALTVPGTVAVAATAAAAPSTPVITSVQTASRVMWSTCEYDTRTGPGPDYDVNGSVSIGDKVRVVKSAEGKASMADSQTWYKLSTGGWMPAKCLSRKAPVDDPDVIVRNWHTTRTVSVRSGPGSDYGLLRKLPKDTPVKVTETAMGWSEDAQDDVLWSHIGGGGWVRSDYIDY